MAEGERPAPVTVVTDSCADLPAELAAALAATGHLAVVPLPVNLDGSVFRDHADLAPADFYARLPALRSLPTTTQPSPGDFLAAYRAARAAGRHVVSVHISARLSGTFASASLAARQLAGEAGAAEQASQGPDEGAGAPVLVLDTGLASMGQGLAVLAAVEAARAVAGAAEVLDAARATAARTRVAFFVDTLEYLQKNGRIGRAAAWAGSLLQVKPLLTLRDGVVTPVERVRGRAHARQRLLEVLAADAAAAGAGRALRVAVLHADRAAEAEELAEAVRSRAPVADLVVSWIGPVVGSHVGPGSLGLAWHPVPA